jgi:pyruvate-formate lyase-activating enzyme
MPHAYLTRLLDDLRAWRRWTQASLSTTRADIALVQCPIWNVDMPSLSLGFLSASAEAQGIRTAVVDVNALLYSKADEQIKKYWHWEKIKFWEDDRFVDLIFKRFRPEIDSYRAAILGGGYRMIGFSVFGTSLAFSVRLARELKSRAPGIPIVFGGHEVDKPSGRALVPPGCCNAHVLGEGEQTLIDLYRSLVERGVIDPRIPGVIVEEGIYTPRPSTRNLDDLPHPTWNGCDLRLYRNGALPLLFSRGCVSRCSFCSDTAHFKRFRHRSPAHMMREIRSHVERYRVHNFRFHDLLINGDVSALDGLCEAIVSSRLDVGWTAMAIAREEMSQDRYRKLRAAGCCELDIGVESGSNRVLKLMRKRVTAEETGRNIELASGAGIKVNISLVIGHPGEEEENVGETIDFLRRHARAIHRVNNVNHCLVTFGSDIWNHPDRYGIVLPEPLATAFYQWRSTDGLNTLELRKERQARVLDTCRELGIPVSFANLYDGAAPDMAQAKRDLMA